jgi:predicted NAD/FAD-binding protein
MQQRLYRRLEVLEIASAAVRAQRAREEERAKRPDPKVRIRWFLAARKFEQMANESLIEAWARSLEISSRELTGLLKAGIDPIHKYLKENGLLEEIKRTVEELKRKNTAEKLPSDTRNQIHASV